MSIVPHKGDDSWVAGALADIKACLTSSKLPDAGEDCEHCRYRQSTGEAIKATFDNSKNKKSEETKPKDTLF